jgi:hypothetical protein
VGFLERARWQRWTSIGGGFWRWGVKYPLTSFIGVVSTFVPHHLTPLSHLPHPKQASPLDLTLSTSMSSSDPTFTFFMSSNGSTNLCPPWTLANHHQHSFRICHQISLHWSSSTTTPSTWFALCDKICVLQEMALANHVWNFPIFRCRWRSSMSTSHKQQPL